MKIIIKKKITKGTFNNNYIQYERRGDKDKILTVNEYLDIIRLHLRDIINDHKTQSPWKIQLTMETHTMRKKSNNIETVMGTETDVVIEELFESLQ